ncbi:transferrin-binding protein-like solute binding protein [Rodentibacter pneumotropicus]|uniref:transferrin-binding protein-like solute binding protein n=1 Tax=Rodentibacter pneumotropicus TaxID=758 RepID=UPI00232D2090|nr:transferrin-binding protein-like solute binding protein [Rodentibacter pneumotropicus]MDC2825363.1 transferrin-binding protein-like solute binding protein [Rodentibacter pneumotropicus]
MVGLTTLVIDGQPLDLAVDSRVKSIEYSRYGIVKSLTDGDLVLFSQGHDVTVLPTGKATYEGGFWGLAGLGENISGITYFDVDFANKKIDGRFERNVKVGNTPYFRFSGSIAGNKFEGKGTAEEYRVGSNLDIKGCFYGPNAEELGGIYESDAVKGAFGASQINKQDR